MSQQLIICRGVPASGKSTYAKAWVHKGEKRVRVNRDDIRLHMFGKLQGVSEVFVTRVEDRMITAGLKSGYSVIVDSTNIRHEYCKRLAELAQDLNVPVEIKTFEISLEDALKRNIERHAKGGNFVPEDVIRNMHEALETLGEPDIAPRFKRVEYSPPYNGLKAIIVDIDGTIAAHGERSPYDLSGVEKDVPQRDVLKLVEWAADAGHQIIIMSGRDVSCKEATVRWLNSHGIWFDRLLMRPAGDTRKDSIVKRELFETHVRHNYQVFFVLDDRQQVVDMWRDLGLRCLQVQPGDF